MKKVLMFLLAAVFTMSVLGCGGKKEDAAQVEVQVALEILTTAWDYFDETNKFSIGGGGYENMTMDAPGAVSISDTDSLTGLFSFPAEKVSMIDDAASMLHAMNANTFTAAAYHVTDSAVQQELADALKDSIMNTQWLCGFPEVMIIAGIGDDYVVTCIGNAVLVEEFKTQITDAYGANILYEESLA